MKNIAEIDKNLSVETKIERDGLCFFDVEDRPFKIYGVFREGEKFRRIPEEIARKVSEGVYGLHANTAGGRVRFITDSPYIVLKAKIKPSKMPHFAISGSCGFDMFYECESGIRYGGPFMPPFDVEDWYESVQDHINGWQERCVTINLPLYSDVYKVYIGLKEGSVLRPAPDYMIEKPVVFYGSSITQGGCASKPGSSYQSLLSRKCNCNYINLGFSGSGRAEDTIVEYIKKLDMSVFVMDYDHNAPSSEYLASTHNKMFKAIRAAQPNLPIIILPRPKYYMTDEEKERSRIIYATYQEATERGDQNVYFISGKELMALVQHNGTVDHTHPSDSGFFSMAAAIEPVLKNILYKKDFCEEEFKYPSKQNNVIYTWVWNEPINKEIIDCQLEEFARAGIGGIYILPMPKNFRPTTMKTNMTPEYLSDDFFDCVRYALNKGKELDMELWLYDEAGWPSGGACGKTVSENPKARETVLYKRDISLNANESYVPSADAIASFYGKSRVKANFVTEVDIIICEYYVAKVSTNHPNCINRVDSTNKSVIDAFINNTYEKYKEALGDTFDSISAIFTDEPSVIAKLIPEDFFEVFIQKYGYDIKDYLYCIDDSSLAETEAECTARIHYGRLLGDLFYTNYCKNIGNWCKKNGKLFAGHLDLDHIPDGGSKQCYFSHLHALSAFDIPGIDVIWHQIRIPEDNMLPVPEGAPFFPRIAASAAHQSGKNLALTESFAVYGDGITPDEFRYVLNYQAIRGINVFNIMLAASGYSRTSSLVERPVFSPKKPGFYNMEHLNTYFKRLSYLLKLGEPQIDTALYIPCADFWANENFSKEASESYIAMGSSLENQNIEFDIIDDYAIIDSKETGNGLKIGNITYRNIYVPQCYFMPEDVLKKIHPYIKHLENVKEVSPIRTLKRKLRSGMLYFIFNESEKAIKTLLNISGDTLYRLNASSGEISKLNDKEITINQGDIAIIYSTENRLNVVSDEVEYSIEIDGFKPVKIKRFIITKDGISLEDVPETTLITNEFSGEITYKAHYALLNVPREGERYKIILKDTVSSARIVIDNTLVASVGITPMEACISGSLLKKRGIIEITVANTAANQIAAQNGIIMSHPKEIIGPYHEKSLIYERKAPAIKFGEVNLIKLSL